MWICFFFFRGIFKGCINSTTLSSAGFEYSVHRDWATWSQWTVCQEKSSIQQEDKFCYMEFTDSQAWHKLKNSGVDSIEIFI